MELNCDAQTPNFKDLSKKRIALLVFTQTQVICTADGRSMLLDYIEGGTLKHLIHDSNGPLPLNQIRLVMKSICGALLLISPHK